MNNKTNIPYKEMLKNIKMIKPYYDPTIKLVCLPHEIGRIKRLDNVISKRRLRIVIHKEITII